MTDKRFTYMIDRVFDLWEVYDNKEKVICLVRNTDAKDLCDLLNTLHEEKESWKHQCISADNQNSMLWNEISYMREQGAKPSDAFEKYLDEISSDYDRFWRRKLKKAKELEGIVND